MLQSQDPTFRHSQLCFPHQLLIPHMASENVHLAIIATCRQCLSIHTPCLIGEVKLNFLNNTAPPPKQSWCDAVDHSEIARMNSCKGPSFKEIRLLVHDKHCMLQVQSP